MCTGLEPVLLGITAGTTAISAISQSQSLKSQAAMQDNQANQQAQLGEIEADQAREDAKRSAARVRAAMANSGVSVDSASATLINQDIIKRGEKDAQVTINNAADKATQLRFAASLDRMRSNQALIAGAAGATSTAITQAHQFGWIK